MKNSSIKYIEWLSAEDMHGDSIQWISELNFMYDELRFFSELIRSNTIELIDSKSYSKNKALIDTIHNFIGSNDRLIERIRLHENKLKIMVDGIDQIHEENSYKDQHRNITREMERHLNDFRDLKSKLFKTIKSILKKQKSSNFLKQ